MNLKGTLKDVIPAQLLKFLQAKKQFNILRKESQIDTNRYFKHARFLEGLSEENIKSDLIFNSHAIEKGLSHPNFRANFGKKALLSLDKSLRRYEIKNYDKSTFEYKNAIAVLRAYKARHDELNVKM